MTSEKPDKIEDKEAQAKKWKELLEKFDKELSDQGLNDEQREELLKELLAGDDT